MQQEIYYTIEETAEMLKVSRAMLYRYMNKGLLAYVVVGERRRIPQSALNAFVRPAKGPAPRSYGDDKRPALAVA